VLAEAEECEVVANGVEEKIPKLDFSGTRRFFPGASIAFSWVLKPWAQARGKHSTPSQQQQHPTNPPTHAERRRARAHGRVTPSEKEITAGEGVAEINRVERMGLETGGAGIGTLACIALGRDEGGDCAEIDGLRRRMAC
jgi:hypothetical protein